MTEAEAEELVLANVPRGTREQVLAYVAALRAEATKQNLISTASLDHLWQRHILDSAQLLALGTDTGTWVDIGSGAGLPGILVAILREAVTVMIEPRAKRALFLQSVIGDLGLSPRASVIAKSAANAPEIEASVISARAVASLDTLFAIGHRFAGRETIWVLPKGRSAAEELATARASWQGDFRLVPSQTDSSASIIVARGVRPKR